MAVVLEAKNVRVDYGRFTALANFDLTLEAGQVLGLVGPNGAGKTTALRAMAGLLPLVTGEVRVLGRRVEPGATGVLCQIGFTPDTPALYEALTVGDFLAFVGRSYGLDRTTIEDRTEFWLEQLWLSDRRDSKVQTLSRGMRQRLAVARTLLPNPTAVLLDEPAAGLDPAGRVQFRRMLASLRDQGKSLVVSSHILSDLHEFCTHIGIMEHGAMRRYGSVASVVGGLDDHRCRYRGTLVTPAPQAAEELRRIPGTSRVELDGRTFVVEYERDPAAAARLLRELLARGFEVSSFAPLEGGLEEAYLRSGVRQVD